MVWPENDYTLETSLIVGLPEELGILEHVCCHIKIADGTHIPISAIYIGSIVNGNKSPLIFKEATKEEITITSNIVALFGIIYQIKDKKCLNGTFCFTFSGWKNDKLEYYYTKEDIFKIEDALF